GVDGAWRYINRLWRLADEPKAALPGKDAAKPAELSPAADAAWRGAHKAIAAGSESLDQFRLNVAVAQIRTLTHQPEGLDATGAKGPGEAWALRQGLEAAVRLIAPLLPHLTEELWAKLGHTTMLCNEPWPKADPTLIVDDTVKVAVQVNGKLRATV